MRGRGVDEPAWGFGCAVIYPTPEPAKSGNRFLIVRVKFEVCLPHVFICSAADFLVCHGYSLHRRRVGDKRSGVETRCRKRLWSAANLATMDRKRDELIAKVDGDREVTWDEIIRKPRVPKGDASTAAKRMKETFGIQRRTPRLKPFRNDIDKAERKRIQRRPPRLKPSSAAPSIWLTPSVPN